MSAPRRIHYNGVSLLSQATPLMPDHSHDPTLFPSTMAHQGSSPRQGEPAPLTQLAQYRIIKQLGRGGMGVVYQAEDTQLHRMAALKVMRPDYAADDEARARFIREARAAAALKHDHIVTIYQVGEENGVPFLAMEFLAGKSLEEWLRPDRRATVPETLLIGKQIARGLAAAHAARLVHRDIKPANLWLEAPRGRVKILDFGLARLAAGEFTNLTQDGSVLGTPAFMAPEQARGDVVDHRCDLFSMGCVLYRMITGRLPFQGTTTFAVLTAIASETPRPAIKIRPEIPPRLSDLVDRLLAKNPQDRPESAQAVLEELVAIEQEVKQPPAPPSLLSSGPHSLGPVVAAVPMIKAPSLLGRKKAPWLWGYAALGASAAVLIIVVVIALLTRGPADDDQGAKRPDIGVPASGGLPSAPPKGGTPARSPPADAQSYGGHRYKFYDEHLSWKEAKARCEQLGGYLVVPYSAEENAFVGNLVAQAAWQDCWIGITDEGQEDKWRTVQGPPVLYKNWLTIGNQPNNKANEEHFALMTNRWGSASDAWRWCDQPNRALAGHQPGFVCEWDLPADETGGDGFSSLFDGRSLAGWEGGTFDYAAENGVLVSKGNGRNHIYTAKEYSDFELQLEFKLTSGANNGIGIRTPRGVLAAQEGIEVQIADDSAFPNWKPYERHGSIYGVFPSKPGYLKPVRQWNSQTIVCQGSKLTVVLNGTTILDVDLEKLSAVTPADGRPHPGLRSRRGYIALCGQKGRVEFRNLRIKEL